MEQIHWLDLMAGCLIGISLGVFLVLLWRGKGVERIVLDMPKESSKRLALLTKMSDSPNPAETIRKALCLYDLCLHETEIGNRLIIVQQDGEQAEVDLTM